MFKQEDFFIEKLGEREMFALKMCHNIDITNLSASYGFYECKKFLLECWLESACENLGLE
jgi:hypothetical protein